MSRNCYTNSRLYGAKTDPMRMATEQEPKDICRSVVGNSSALMR